MAPNPSSNAQRPQEDPSRVPPSSPDGTLGGMNAIQIGYARVSTSDQDLTAQRDALLRLGVLDSNIYVDHGLTGRNDLAHNAMATMDGAARTYDVMRAYLGRLGTDTEHMQLFIWQGGGWGGDVQMIEPSVEIRVFPDS